MTGRSTSIPNETLKIPGDQYVRSSLVERSVRLGRSIRPVLRVVETWAILFFESMSEWDGSEIERLWILMTSTWIDFESIYKFIIQLQCRCMSDPTLSDIDFKYGLGLYYP